MQSPKPCSKAADCPPFAVVAKTTQPPPLKEPPPVKPTRAKAQQGTTTNSSAAPRALDENPYAAEQESGESDPFGRNHNPEELATSADRQKVVRAKAILQAKANSGRATEQELRMLKTLCQKLGDNGCSQ